MIKNILFDLGGVFIRLTRDECVRRFVKMGVYDADAQLDPYCQTGLFLDLELGRYTAEGFAQKLSEVYGISLSADDVAYGIRGFLPEVEEYKFDYIAHNLPKDVRLLLISNTNTYAYSWANSSEFLSNQRPLTSFFDKVYTSFQLGMCKPDKRLFEHIITDAKIDPKETLFVDDGPTNCLAAQQLGFISYCPNNGEDWTKMLEKLFSYRNK